MSSTIVAISLIKEFLSVSGYTKTLESLQCEVGNANWTSLISSRKVLAKSLGISKQVRLNRAKESPLSSFLEVLVDYVHSKLPKSRSIPMAQVETRRPLPMSNQIEIESIEDLDLSDNENVPSPKRTTAVNVLSFSKTDEDQFASLLFSSPNPARFPPEWKGKGFQFQQDLTYGLVQLKGGPCGLIASVQAKVLKTLIYDYKVMSAGDLRPSPTIVKQALVDVMSDIIWQAGNGTAKLLVCKGGLNDTGAITHGFGYSVHHSKTKLKDAIQQNIGQFCHLESNGNGLIQLLLSVIYTRGFQTIRKYMDSFSESLIGRHSYCTQELVNLMLYGKAISNLHDGDIDIDGQILHGIHSQVDIGQLSLFEYYDNFKIGNFVKNSTFPIYVLCSESHYTVLFSFAKESDVFDIYYYDELANQTEDIRLTLKRGQKQSESRDMVPPIELCLQTKFGKTLQVNWNGTEPLL